MIHHRQIQRWTYAHREEINAGSASWHARVSLRQKAPHSEATIPRRKGSEKTLTGRVCSIMCDWNIGKSWRVRISKLHLFKKRTLSGRKKTWNLIRNQWSVNPEWESSAMIWRPSLSMNSLSRPKEPTVFCTPSKPWRVSRKKKESFGIIRAMATPTDSSISVKSPNKLGFSSTVMNS